MVKGRFSQIDFLISKEMVSPLLIKMKTGKIAPDLLKKLIFSNLGIERDEVMVHSCIGEDSSVIDFGDRLCVLSTDPITGASKGIGKYAVNISCNDVASNGAEPLGVMITLLLPENFTEEGIASIMKEINDAATKLNVEVLGGHTEVTTAVNQVIISCTAVGIVDRDKLVTSSGASPGDDIVLTKWAGLEGTAILATEFEEELKRFLDPALVDKAKEYSKYISAVREGLIAAEYGVTAMHDVTEGGVLGAMYEMCEASGTGAELWFDNIPVREETKAICQYFKIDPLCLISSGAMLITTKDGTQLTRLFDKNGISAKVIGKVTKAGKNFDVVYRDELWKVLSD